MNRLIKWIEPFNFNHFLSRFEFTFLILSQYCVNARVKGNTTHFEPNLMKGKPLSFMQYLFFFDLFTLGLGL